MTTTISIGDPFTLDETPGLQIGGVPGVDPTEDNNDQDVLLESDDPVANLEDDAPDFYERLFTDLGLSTSFPDLIGVSTSADDFVQVSSTGYLTDVSFSVIDGVATEFNTTGGDRIYLYNDPTDPNIVYGIIGDQGDSALTEGDLLTLAASNDIAFAIYLDETFSDSDSYEGQLWVVEFQPLENIAVASVSTDTDGDGSSTNEVQTITFDGAVTGGTFTLSLQDPSLNGGAEQTTGAIAYDPTDPASLDQVAADIESALENLTDVTDVTVSRSGTVFTVTFNDLDGTSDFTNLSQIVIDDASLVGGDTGGDDGVVLNLDGLLNISASELATFDFVGAPSGQNLFLAGENGTGSIQLIVTGLDPNPDKLSQGGTVNSSQASKFAESTLGSGSQAVDPTEGLVLTFVEGMDPDFVIPMLSPKEAKDEASIDFVDVHDSTGGRFIIAQTTPNHSDVALTLKAYTTDAEPGAGNFSSGIGDGDDSQVTINSVTVVDQNGDPAGAVVTYDYDGMGGVWITGLEAGDVVTYTTTGIHNRLEIVNPGEFDDLFVSADTDGNDVDTNEVQIVTIDGPAQSSFFLTLDGEDTVAIEFDPTDSASLDQVAADIESALQGLTDVNDVTVTRSGNDFTVTFNDLGAAGADPDDFADLPLMTVTSLADGDSFDIGDFSLLEAGSTNQSFGAEVQFEDDGPTASLVSTGEMVTVDETAGLQTGSDNISADVTTDFDGDSPTDTQNEVQTISIVAQGGSFTLSLQDSGLNGGAEQTTAAITYDPTNSETLDQVAADIESALEGFADVNDVDVSRSGSDFTVTFLDVGAAGADFTDLAEMTVDGSGLTDPEDDDDDEVLSTADFNLAMASVSTDSDGGGGSNEFQIVTIVAAGGSFTLTFDGLTTSEIDYDPTNDASLNQVAADLEDALEALGNVGVGNVQVTRSGSEFTVEFVGALADTDVSEMVVNDANLTEVGVDVSMIFADVGSKSADLTPQYAISSSALVTPTSDPGVDDEGSSTILSLELKDADTETAAGADTARSTDLETTDGTAIYLVKEGDLIVGREFVSEAGGVVTLGDAVFAVAIDDSGNVATVQWGSLQHPTSPNDFDEAVDLTDGSGSFIEVLLTETDGDGDVATDVVDIGSQVKFEDDGPFLGEINSTVVALVDSTTDADPMIDSDEAELPLPPTPEADGDDKVTFNFDPGADDEGASLAIIDYTGKAGAGEFVGTGLDDLADLLDAEISVIATDTSVTYLLDGVEWFRLTVNVDDPDYYTFEVLEDSAFVTQPLIFPGVKPGAPTESETLDATTASGKNVSFDGLLWSNDAQDLDDPAANLGPLDAADDINANDVGFGVKNDQASQINNLEGFSATFGDGAGPEDDEVGGLVFEIEGIGNISEVTVEWLAFDDLDNDGVLDPGENFFTGNDTVALPNGNNSIEYTIEHPTDVEGNLFDTVYVRFITPDGEASDDPKDWNDGVRILNFNSVEPLPVPDVELAFAVQGTDGDGDTSQIQEFTVGIDGDDDDLITI